MENNTRNIDQILLNKKYNELSAEEFLVIKDEIPTESEYNDLRAMLIAAEKELKSAQEIEPKESTKAFLMNEFSKMHPATRTSAGGLGFLFPKDRAFYQKPGYQLLAVAAIVVLIITIFPRLNSDMTGNEEMAQHNVEPPKNNQQEITKQVEDSVADEKTELIVTEDESDNTSEAKTLLEKEKLNSQVTTDLTTAKNDGIGGSKDKEATIDGSIMIEEVAEAEEAPYMAPALEQPSSDSYGSDDMVDNLSENTVATGSSFDMNEGNNTSGNVNTVTEVASNEMAIMEDAEAMEEVAVLSSSKGAQKERANKKTDMAPPPVKTVKSLAENAELIDLFYTAM